MIPYQRIQAIYILHAWHCSCLLNVMTQCQAKMELAQREVGEVKWGGEERGRGRGWVGRCMGVRGNGGGVHREWWHGWGGHGNFDLKTHTLNRCASLLMPSAQSMSSHSTPGTPNSQHLLRVIFLSFDDSTPSTAGNFSGTRHTRVFTTFCILLGNHQDRNVPAQSPP